MAVFKWPLNCYSIRRILVYSYHMKSACSWSDGNGQASFYGFPFQNRIVYIRQMVRVRDRYGIGLPTLYQLGWHVALGTFRVRRESKHRLPDHKWYRLQFQWPPQWF